jgi:hypothetical protein
LLLNKIGYPVILKGIRYLRLFLNIMYVLPII